MAQRANLDRLSAAQSRTQLLLVVAVTPCRQCSVATRSLQRAQLLFVIAATLVAACSAPRRETATGTGGLLPSEGSGRTESVLPQAGPGPGSDAPSASPTPSAPPKANDDAAPNSPLVTLERDARGPVVLVEEATGLVARTATGATVRTLVAGSLSHTQYEPRTRVVWFVRDHRLEALDLASTAPTVVVVEGMPDIEFHASPAVDLTYPFCGGCVLIASSPVPAIRVLPDEPYIGYTPHGDEVARFARDSKLAAQANPTLTADGARLLERLSNHSMYLEGEIPLGDTLWPLPTRARKLTGCDSGCGRGFDLPGLHRVLLVTGRVCDCLEDLCRSTCVHYDPTRHLYARPSSPGIWSQDAIPEPACHPTLDTSGAAYVLDEHHVCTARGCTKVTGRIVGWLRPGMRTAPISEDLTTCPE